MTNYKWGYTYPILLTVRSKVGCFDSFPVLNRMKSTRAPNWFVAHTEHCTLCLHSNQNCTTWICQHILPSLTWLLHCFFLTRTKLNCLQIPFQIKPDISEYVFKGTVMLEMICMIIWWLSIYLCVLLAMLKYLSQMNYWKTKHLS